MEAVSLTHLHLRGEEMGTWCAVPSVPQRLSDGGTWRLLSYDCNHPVWPLMSFGDYETTVGQAVL